MDEKIAVIVPARGSPEAIDKCIGSLVQLDYPCFEVIIVDDGLSDAARQKVELYKGKLRIIESNGRGPSFARNEAARNTDAEYVAFTDSDCIVEKDWLTQLIRGFALNPQSAGCGGTQKLPRDATPFERLVFVFMQRAGFMSDYVRTVPQGEIIEISHSPSCCVMYRRKVFLEEGGFLEGLWPGEDVEFDYRLKRKGYRLFFNPNAVVYHYKPKTLGAFTRMFFRYGLVQGMLVRRYGIFRKTQIAPILAVLVLLSMAVLPLRSLRSLRSLLIFATALFLIGLAIFCFNPLLTLVGFTGFLFWNLGFVVGIFKKIR